MRLILLDQIQQYLANDFLNLLIPRVSSLGDAGLIWIVLSVLLLLFPKTRKAGLASGIALLFMLVTGNMILKPLVARLRPFAVNTAVELLIPPPTDFSFLSGHTYASFASASAIFRNSRRIGIPALILASLIAFSRLYLYVHYPTDVLFGILLGILAGWIGNRLSERLLRQRRA
ncbi:MAG TPA: phosphatase PAP2 family protein [Candidatus Eisenbergiella stercorigallinarum]|uniref:Phosphatase PAP2 family protein n=1 Tax=Candidatus Eisenbergiella stercorigallinarum TaxID=2838557 RepID=A0A9D2R1F1_9FIRM|nr:phosphatase PAP2 family protein [Candidatus Eisenbergiella stercorigallinarum]